MRAAGLARIVPALAGLVLAQMADATTPSPDIRILCPRPPACGTTFIAELGNAPFPVPVNARDQRGDPFWHGLDAATGERYRQIGEHRYLEKPNYSDARVLFHAPKRFDPAKPFRIVLFLHGHFSEIERTLVTEYDLPGQIDRSGANAVLIAPQLARDAQESVPGKFAEAGRAASFVDEAVAALRHMVGGSEAAWRQAPIVLAAYSGGYRTAGQIVARGGLAERIEGVVLLDAIYADTGIYAGWLEAHRQRAFLYAIYSKSSAVETAALKAELRARDIPYVAADDGGPMSGVRLIEIETPHGEIPLKGPPAEPLGAVLSRLPREEEAPALPLPSAE